MPQYFAVQSLEAPVRLSRWLMERFNLSYARAQALIRKSAIRVNGVRVRTDTLLQDGSNVALYASLATKPSRAPQAYNVNLKLKAKLLHTLQSSILLEDEHIIALNKPSGIATQGGTGVRISIDDVLVGLCPRPRLVHRLDKDTTGVLLIAKTRQVAAELASLFRNNKVNKRYLAYVVGTPKPASGTITDKVAKIGEDDNLAKIACTKYRLLSCSKLKAVTDQDSALALVEFSPLTGRTHQIRIHAARSLGTPIAGDTKYGGKTALTSAWPRKILCLHSAETSFELFGKSYCIEAPVPAYMIKHKCVL